MQLAASEKLIRSAVGRARKKQDELFVFVGLRKKIYCVEREKKLPRSEIHKFSAPFDALSKNISRLWSEDIQRRFACVVVAVYQISAMIRKLHLIARTSEWSLTGYVVVVSDDYARNS